MTQHLHHMGMTAENLGFDSRAVHAGRGDLTAMGVHVPPIDLSTTYPLPDQGEGGQRPSGRGPWHVHDCRSAPGRSRPAAGIGS